MIYYFLKYFLVNLSCLLSLCMHRWQLAKVPGVDGRQQRESGLRELQRNNCTGKNHSTERDSSHCTLPLTREMSGSFGIGVKMTGKKPVLIEGVDQANCDFASMDAPRSFKKDSIRDDPLPKSGNMSADMDAALRKLENRRAAASLIQTPHAPANSREEARPQYVSTRCSNPL